MDHLCCLLTRDSGKSRICYILLIIISFAGYLLSTEVPSIALAIQSSFPGTVSACNPDFVSDCFSRCLLIRWGAVLGFFFLVLMLISASFGSKGEYLDRSYWPLKAIILFIGFFYSLSIPNQSLAGSFFTLLQSLSVLWLFVVGVVIVESVHQFHRYILTTSDAVHRDEGWESAKWWYYLHSVSSLSVLALDIVITCMLYSSLPTAECSGLLFTTNATACIGFSLILLSMFAMFNKGLLIPSVVLLYCSLLSWYAILSSPNTSCNPSASANNTGSKLLALYINLALTVYTIFFGIVKGKVRRLCRLVTESYSYLPPTKFEAGSLSGDRSSGGPEKSVSDIEHHSPFPPLSSSPAMILYKKERDLTSTSGPLSTGPVSSLSSSSSNETAHLLGYGSKHPSSYSLDGNDDPGNNSCYDRKSTGLAGEMGSAVDSMSPFERSFSHALFFLASAFSPVLLSSWGYPDGSPEAVGSNSSSSASLSLDFKVGSQVLVWILFLSTMINACRVYNDLEKKRQY